MDDRTDTKEIQNREGEESSRDDTQRSCCYVVDSCGCYVVDPCCCTPSYACCC